MTTRTATPRLVRELREMSERLLLELVERLPEGGREVAAAIDALPERLEVADDAVKAVALDQIIREEIGQLVRGVRPVAQVPYGEPPRGAQRLEIQAPFHDGRMLAHGLDRGEPPAHHRVQPQALEHTERNPLRHPLREPLLATPLAFRELDLRHVRQLVRHQTHPLAAADVRFMVQQELPSLAHADREIAQLRGPDAGHLTVVDQPLLEDLPRGV